jgi:hypothetical protein
MNTFTRRSTTSITAFAAMLFIGASLVGWTTPSQKNPKKKAVQKPKQFIGDNLILNPGCEELHGDFATHWSPDTDATFMKYNFVSNELTDNTAGPAIKDRGNNYFHVSREGVQQRMAFQTIELASARAAIDSGNLGFQLGGWMGGLDDEPITMLLHGTFKDADGKTLLHVMTDSVRHTERNDKPALLYRESTGTVPVGATSVIIGLETAQTDTNCTNCSVNGYADNLVFSLKRLKQ